MRQYNYGNADYDVRHSFNLNYVYNTPTFHGLWGALLNWTVAGTIFARSGLPFTVVDGATTGALGGYNYGPSPINLGLDLFANSFVGPLSCNSSATTTPCRTSAQFASVVVPGGAAGFGNQRRNQIYGPVFFDTDLTLMKNFKIPHWEGAELQVGAQAFNLFNHPNFDQPVSDVSNSQFGSIVRTIGPPTSLFGSFLGAMLHLERFRSKRKFVFSWMPTVSAAGLSGRLFSCCPQAYLDFSWASFLLAVILP